MKTKVSKPGVIISVFSILWGIIIILNAIKDYHSIHILLLVILGIIVPMLLIGGVIGFIYSVYGRYKADVITKKNRNNY